MAIRKALLVGINAYTSYPLRGCVNDVLQMQALLKTFYGFVDGDIKLVLDGDATLQGIKAGLAWLAEGGADADAVRVFHFSGHGTQIADENGDEPDGRDECLVPYDYEINGMLVDDALKTLYDKFPETGNLTLIMDSCHSGSVQKGFEQARYRFIPMSPAERERADAARRRFESSRETFIVDELKQVDTSSLAEDELRKRVARLMSAFVKGRFGDVRAREANVLVAGCRSDQQSADDYIAGGYHGAFTYCLAEAIQERQGNLTYREMAQAVGKKLGVKKYAQVPQLEYRDGRDHRTVFRPFN